MRAITYDTQGLAALDYHLEHAGHKRVSVTCPVCVDLVRQGTIVIGNDGIGRTIEQVKDQRTENGYEPGQTTAKDLAHFRRVCPHGGVFRGEVCGVCGATA